jgi:hypothetical protein
MNAQELAALIRTVVANNAPPSWRAEALTKILSAMADEPGDFTNAIRELTEEKA